MTKQRFYPVFTMPKSLSAKIKPDSSAPDIDIRFDQVTLTLTTHDAGGITEKDFSVARQCDVVCLSFFAFRSMQIIGQITKV
jgi:4a-hydroxytetrahydrobiopterin dehydratase